MNELTYIFILYVQQQINMIHLIISNVIFDKIIKYSRYGPHYNNTKLI